MWKCLLTVTELGFVRCWRIWYDKSRIHVEVTALGVLQLWDLSFGRFSRLGQVQLPTPFSMVSHHCCYIGLSLAPCSLKPCWLMNGWRTIKIRLPQSPPHHSESSQKWFVERSAPNRSFLFRHSDLHQAVLDNQDWVPSKIIYPFRKLKTTQYISYNIYKE